MLIKINAIEEDYEITKTVLGRGISCKVFQCISIKTREKFALKALKDDAKSRREVELHCRASACEHVVRVIDVYNNTVKSQQYLIIVMECMKGGELFDRIQKHSEKPFTEREAAEIILQICKAIDFLHSNDIAHRDLKPENLLYADESPEAILKLADFGFAKTTSSGKSLQTPCYTPYYAAPEILSREKYDKSCDMWSLGVVMYILLCGYPPFYSTHNLPMSAGMKMKIRSGQYEFRDAEWSSVSTEAKDLIKGLLVTEPDKRLTIKQAMANEWVMNPSHVPTTHLHSAKILNDDTDILEDAKDAMDTALAEMRTDDDDEDTFRLKNLADSRNPMLNKRRKKIVHSIGGRVEETLMRN